MKLQHCLTFNRILAYMLIILGAIHDIATFSPIIQGGIYNLHKSVFNAMIFMSLGTGTSFILCGIILVILSKADAIKMNYLKQIVIITSIYVFSMGILAVIMMPSNPFAWFSVVLNLAIFLISMILSKK